MAPGRRLRLLLFCVEAFSPQMFPRQVSVTVLYVEQRQTDVLDLAPLLQCPALHSSLPEDSDLIFL